MPKNIPSENKKGERPVKQIIMSSNLPEILSRLIEERGLSYTALADSIGTTRQSISNYAKGSVPPPSDMLDRLSQYFGVTTDYLLGKTNCSTDIPDKRAACDYTGLSEKAIDNLVKLNDSPIDHNIKMISYILEHEQYIDFFCQLSTMFENLNTLRDHLIELKKSNLRDYVYGLEDLENALIKEKRDLAISSSQAHLASLCFSDEIFKAMKYIKATDTAIEGIHAYKTECEKLGFEFLGNEVLFPDEVSKLNQMLHEE